MSDSEFSYEDYTTCLANLIKALPGISSFSDRYELERKTQKVVETWRSPRNWADHLLAIAFTYDTPELRVIAFPSIKKVAALNSGDSSVHDAICQAWYNLRSPELEEYVLEHPLCFLMANYERGVRIRVATALKKGTLSQQYQFTMCSATASYSNLEGLIDATVDRDPIIAEHAWASLPQFHQSACLQRITEFWATHPNHPSSPGLLAFVIQHKFIPNKPPEARFLLELCLQTQTDTLPDAAFLNTLLLVTMYPAYTLAAKSVLNWLSQLDSPELQNLICRSLVTIPHDLNEAWEIILQKGYQPHEVAQQALFLFLGRQWERYEALDFDYRYLRMVYYEANPALRRRIAQTVRRSGKMEYLDYLQGLDYKSVAKIAPITNQAEFDSLIVPFFEQQAWPTLWKLALSLPPVWSVPILIQLFEESGWQPENLAERMAFQQLGELFESIPALQEAISAPAKLLPPAFEFRLLNIQHQISGLAFNAQGIYLAVGTVDGYIFLWNFSKSDFEKEIFKFGQPVTHLAYLANNCLVAAIGPDSRQGNLYQLVYCEVRADQVFTRVFYKTTHPIVDLQPDADNFLLALTTYQELLGFEITPRESRLVFSTRSEVWQDSVKLCSNGILWRLLRKNVVLDVKFSWEQEKIEKIEGLSATAKPSFSGAITADFAPDGQALLALTTFKNLQYVPNDWIAPGNNGPHLLAKTVEAFVSLRKSNFVAAALEDGKLQFFDWRTKQSYVAVEGYLGHNLLVSNYEETLLAETDGSKYVRLWDLRTLLWHRRWYSTPFSAISPKELGILELAQQKEANPLLKYLLIVLRLRYSGVIEIADFSRAEASATDIELD